jgi:hypothetical protein
MLLPSGDAAKPSARQVRRASAERITNPGQVVDRDAEIGAGDVGAVDDGGRGHAESDRDGLADLLTRRAELDRLLDVAVQAVLAARRERRSDGDELLDLAIERALLVRVLVELHVEVLGVVLEQRVRLGRARRTAVLEKLLTVGVVAGNVRHAGKLLVAHARSSGASTGGLYRQVRDNCSGKPSWANSLALLLAGQFHCRDDSRPDQHDHEEPLEGLVEQGEALLDAPRISFWKVAIQRAASVRMAW